MRLRSNLLRLPEQSLAAGENQQSARTHAGRGATATHRNYEMGQAALSRDGNAVQPAS
jgi:hypothetical protein